MKISMLLLFIVLVNVTVFAEPSAADVDRLVQLVRTKDTASIENLLKSDQDLYLYFLPGESVYEKYRSYPVSFAIYESLDPKFVRTLEAIFVREHVWGYFPPPDGPLSRYWRFWLIIFAMEKNNYDLLDFILALYPTSITDGWQSDHGGVMYSPPAAFFAVGRNQLKLVRYFIAKKFPIDYYSDDHNSYAKNLLSVSGTPEMEQYLKSVGVSEIITFKEERKTRTIDGDIRVRESFGLDGKVIAKLPTGMEVSLLAITAKSFKVNGQEDRWIKIRLPDGTVGWSFYSFFYKDNGI